MYYISICFLMLHVLYIIVLFDDTFLYIIVLFGVTCIIYQYTRKNNEFSLIHLNSVQSNMTLNDVLTNSQPVLLLLVITDLGSMPELSVYPCHHLKASTVTSAHSNLSWPFEAIEIPEYTISHIVINNRLQSHDHFW